jgi:hypothetical protein
MRAVRGWFVATGCLVVLACGARTGLVIEEEIDAGKDAGIDATLPHDAGRDVVPQRDAGLDARDAHDAPPDVPPDVIPPIDVVRVDARAVCEDGGDPLVYVIGANYHLFSFDPPTLAFTEIGPINCNDGTNTPFSMGVDRQGIARVVFTADGKLFRVSTKTASCQPTPYVPGQHGFRTFGMGYTADTDGGGETLYVASVFTDRLGAIDDSYVLRPIGPFVPRISDVELTGTGGGQLFGFWSRSNTDPDSFISQIDPQTARVTGQVTLTGVSQGFAWAFAFWGGDFYVFTSPNGGLSQVTRYSPADGGSIEVVVPQAPTEIVGAGVSTCAPQQ